MTRDDQSQRHLRRAHEIFCAAFDLEPKARRAFLDEACSDDRELRNEVEALFAADEVLQQNVEATVDMPRIAGSRVVEAASAAPQPRASSMAPRALPESIGPYRIIKVLGEGGMGTVYLAEQRQPIVRRVALKVIKLGMDTHEVIARFDAERQALALMDHSGIARVYDAGSTGDGRPYFVMEYVSGEPINDYCDRQRLTTRERLELFVSVCDAVQHAHQKAIVHRDLKPSNILVGVQDGRPVAKIIDFGIAKATDRRLTEKTLFTEQGQMIGTPAYMSPEQAEAEIDVDTRTDIYSLGVILYELLVGVLPFDSKELFEGGYRGIQQLIREKEPRKPSTRLRHVGEDSSLAAKKRSTSVQGLASQIRGDLDWISIKAMEKDRTRRYASASEFAADIRRHLELEPVVAGPPSAAYRVRKLLRKHRGPVTAAVLVVLTLVGGLITSTILYLRASSEREAKEIALTLQKEETVRANAATNKAQRLLEASRHEEGRAWWERAQSRVDQKDFFGAKLLAARAIGFDGFFGRESRDEAFRQEFPLLLRSGSKEERAARSFLRGCVGFVPVWWQPPGEVKKAPKDKEEGIPSERHSGRVASVDFSPDGRVVATGGEDATVRLWNVATGGAIAALSGHSREIRAVEFSDDGRWLLSASEDGTARVWNVATKEVASTVDSQGRGWMLLDAGISPDGRTVALAVFNRVALWNVESGPQTLLRHGDQVDTTGHSWVDCVAFGPHGQTLASASRDNTVRVWDARTGAEFAKLSTDGESQHVAFGPQGDMLASAIDDGTLRVWAVPEGTELLRLPQPSGAVAFDPTGSLLVAQSGGQLVLWNLITQAKVVSLLLDGEPLIAPVFSPDGRTLACGTGAGGVVLWDVTESGARPGFSVKTLAQGKKSMPYVYNALEFSPDSRLLAIGASNGVLRLWDVQAGYEERVFVQRFGFARLGVKSVAFAPDGRTIASAGSTPRLWNIPTGAEVSLDNPDRSHERANRVAFRPDGRILAAGSESGTLRLWDTAHAREVATLSHPDSVTDLTYSPDGRILVSSGSDMLRVWRFARDEVTQTDTASKDGSAPAYVDINAPGVTSLSFHPDGALLASGDETGAVVVWDMPSGRSRHRITGHAGRVTNVAFSPDGRIVASGSTDGTVRLWNVSMETEVTTFLHHVDGVTSVAFSPDGKWFAVAGRIIRLWSMDQILRGGENYAAWFSYMEVDGREIRWKPERHADDSSAMDYIPVSPDTHVAILRRGEPEAATDGELFWQYLRAQNHSAAAFLLRKLGEEATDRQRTSFVDAIVWKAETLLDRGRRHMPARYLRLAETFGDSSPRYWRARARLFELNKEPSKVLQAIERALACVRQGSGDLRLEFDLYHRRFRICLEQKRLKDAKVALELILKLDWHPKPYDRVRLTKSYLHAVVAEAPDLEPVSALFDVCFDPKRPEPRESKEVAPPANEIVEAGAVWRYLDQGDEPVAAWRTVEFDASTWHSGAAPLGFGDDGVATEVRRNASGSDSDPSRLTFYFRHRFELEKMPTGLGNPRRFDLFLDVVCDDGLVVYLNGDEVVRHNIPEGTVDSSTLATASVSGSAEGVVRHLVIDSKRIRAGANLLAAEVHQAEPTSSDLHFRLALVMRLSPITEYLARLSENELAALLLKSDSVLPDEWGRRIRFVMASTFDEKSEFARQPEAIELRRRIQVAILNARNGK